MSTFKIAFFWHMHQPCYKDLITQKYILPWIRLHSIREYHDMISIITRFPEVRQTFNLVPSLLNQIIDYTDNNISDLFLDYTLKPVSELDINDKKFILKNFFMCNKATMIDPFPRYLNLFKKRDINKLTDKELLKIDIIYTKQDYLDLQVWFNLSWFGYSSLAKIPELNELINKGRNFTEADKRYVIDKQMEIMKSIITLYKNAQDIGTIEITTSPFYHPILPILFDDKIIKRIKKVKRDREEIPHISYPEDVNAQISNGIAFYNAMFQKPPAGLWPPEGCLTPELIPIFCKNGIKWIASDERLLTKTFPRTNRHKILYKPYRAVYKNEAIDIVFRDRVLSELIAYSYSKKPADEAAGDFIKRLHTIKNSVSSYQKDGIVFVILDGENPWENYKGSGEAFLSELYTRIQKEEEFETVKIGEYLRDNPPKDKIENLYTGSWLPNDFDNWIGDEEDNKAWEHIKNTRSVLTKHIKEKKVIDKGTINAAWEEIYIAEGSDWFWWYGDKSSTESNRKFDSLFRAHLEMVYKLLNINVPGDLKMPIKKDHDTGMWIKPVSFISPVIDGIENSYFEWLGAGRFSLIEKENPNPNGKGYFLNLFYGFNAKELFLRIDPVKGGSFLTEDFNIHIHIFYDKEYVIIFNCMPKENSNYTLYSTKEGVLSDKIISSGNIGINTIVELSLKFDDIKLTPDKEARFVVELMKNDIEVDRYPRYKFISFTAPLENFEDDMWSTI